MNSAQANASPFTKVARKTALEQAILLLRENKDDNHPAVRTALLNHLNGLLAFNLEQKAEEKSAPEEEKSIANFRQYLREQILPALHNQTFQLQLTLARHWPVNSLDAASHQPQDPYSLEVINNFDEVIPLSSGHLFLKRSLTQFYAQRQAYDNQGWCHPIVVGIHLSPIEVEHLLNQGIAPPEGGAQLEDAAPPEDIARPEGVAHPEGAARPADIAHHLRDIPDPEEFAYPEGRRRYNGVWQQLREQNNFTLFNNAFTDFLQRRYSYKDNAPKAATNNYFISIMRGVGVGIGIMLVYAAFIFIVVSPGLLVPMIPPFIPLLCLISTIINTFIINIITDRQQAALGEIVRREHSDKNWLSAIASCAISLGFGMIGIGIISALGASAIISVPAFTATIAIWGCLLPIFPLLPMIIAATQNAPHPSRFHQLYTKINLVLTIGPVVALGALFGETARLLSRAAYAIRDLFRPGRFQPARQDHPSQAARPEPEPRVRNELSANAQIHRGLGAEPAAPVPPVANQNPALADADPQPVINLPAPVLAAEEHARSVLSP